MGRLIFGGSFNPVHIGHMRVAIEALSLLAHKADMLEFMPSASPPHKPCAPMLPFELRVRLIEAAIHACKDMVCDPVEGDRAGLSYTWDTLELLGRHYGAANLYFLLGSQDFALLPEWHRGMELVKLCHLAIVPRGDYSEAAFLAACRGFWPGEPEYDSPGECMGTRICSYKLQSGYRVYFLPAPYLEISATYIRKIWLCQGNLDYLVPGPALEILKREHRTVDACWREKKC